MSDIVARWGGVILTALAAVPLAGLVVWALARWRGTWREPSLEVAMVLGTLPWLWLILRPNGTGRSLTLLPLTDLADLGGAPAATVVEQLGGNLLVLAALGCCLPMRWAALAALWRVALVAACASVGVEVLQYALAIGRHSSVYDVLLNTAGAVLAAACSRRWWAGRRWAGRRQVAGPPGVARQAM